ncbi:MAG: VWA domain-containing protein [Sphingobacteriales bacterium]|nr:MAG: VWA domain-containing protein [Sphingobacteriales bacterium]
MSIGEWRLAQPEALLLLLLLPVLWWVHARRSGTQTALRLPATAVFRNLRPSARVRAEKALPYLRTLALVAMITALARPQEHHVSEYIESEGIDIVLAVDVSGSMLAEDLQPNRLEAAKRVAADFIRRRPADRIGLVIFSGESFTQVPATMDHNALLQNLEVLRAGGMLTDGTAIGDGLATAVDRVRSGGKSKVIVLMTDGVNNREHISPGTALQIAKTFGVKVYTIGIGTTGTALVSIQTPYGVEKMRQDVQIDEPLLRQIASGTGGRYFRATDNASLQAIYGDIDRLEKQKIETTSEEHTREWAWPFLVAAAVLLLAELLLRWAWLQTVEAD